MAYKGGRRKSVRGDRLKVLVTGATGYIGGRLVPRLVEAGHEVRVLVRNAARVQGRPWAAEVEVIEGDLLDASSLPAALEGVDVAYYLVHAMGAGGDFAERDRRAATNFAAAAGGVTHTIYLGGLLPPGGANSEHLASRAEVGEILRRSLRLTEFRAGPVIGSGSGSFEMVRYLTERLPVMVAPRWILNPVQPIAIRDVLAYLQGALDTGPLGVVEIGSPDRLSFRDMMLGYAKVRGLRRLIVPVPVLTPRLAGLWVGLVTPIPNSLAVPLIKGIIKPVVADTSVAEKAFPAVVPIGYERAVELALRKVEHGEVETRWSGALGPRDAYELEEREGLVREHREIVVDAPPDAVYAAFVGMGGQRGWGPWTWAWRARGVLDRLVGGPGLRRGRRDPRLVYQGEAIDFWRVEEVEPGTLLRLRAEMKVPGRAWIEWRAEPHRDGTRLVQEALFAPRGFIGWVYWVLLYPLHRPIFSSLARTIARDARERPAPKAATTTAITR